MEVIMAAARKHPQVKSPQPDSLSPSYVPVVDPFNLPMLALNDMGIIQHCSQTCEQVFGYRQVELEGRHVSTLLPELANTELVLEDRINSRLAFFCHCAIPFQARRRDGNMFTSELFINRLCSHNVVVLVRSLDV
jgi:PAS domain S-box-containing protein